MSFHEALLQRPGAMGWLENRGLTRETISRHLLGFVSTDLAGDDGFQRFSGCIAIPYLNGPRDRVTGFTFRREVGVPKYDRQKGFSAHLFNVTATEDAEVYITEGEFDAMVLGQLGMAACGISGASTFKRAWRYLFRDCQKVTVVFDGDEAGEKGSYRVVGAMRDICPVEVVSLPPGKDVTDLYLESPDKLREILA